MNIATIRKRSQRLIDTEGKSCEECGKKGKLHRHHIKMEENSVILLCPQCHTKYHMKNGTWGKGLRKTKNCVICGREFVPNHSKKHKTCSGRCLSELGRLNALKRWQKTEQTDSKLSEIALSLR